MRVYFVVPDRSEAANYPVIGEVMDTLHGRGFDVQWEAFERLLLRPDQLLPESDLYVLHSHNAVALSLAGILYGQGVRTLNPFPSCLSVFDRLVALQRLSAAGIPTPRTWTTRNPTFIQSLLETKPLVVKPLRASDDLPVRRVTRLGELDELLDGPVPLLFQEQVGGEVDRFRATVIGGEVFLSRVSQDGSRLTRCGASYGIYDLAHHCGQALALYIYSLDLVAGRDGFVVTDIDYVPDYRVVGSPSCVAACIERYYRLFFSVRESAGNGAVVAEPNEASI